MTTALCNQTWTDLARSVAWEFGIDLSFDEAADLLWNVTGFPDFWTGSVEKGTFNPREECMTQLRAYFEKRETDETS